MICYKFPLLFKKKNESTMFCPSYPTRSDVWWREGERSNNVRPGPSIIRRLEVVC